MIKCVNPENGFCWNTVDPEYVSPTKFNDIINELKEDKDLLQFNWIKLNIKYRRIANKWFMFDSENRKEIRVNRELKVETETDEEGNISYVCTVEFHRYIWLKDKVISVDDSVVDDEKSGMEAYRAIEEKFNYYNSTKSLALESIFSGRKYRSEYSLIKGCVPVQIQYMNPGYKGQIVEGVYKADVSSAFPTQIMKDLPTLHGSIVVPGRRVEPSEKFPFAFYTRSHHIKTLDGYDSHEMNSWYYREYYKCDDSIKDEDELTILCPKMSEKYHEALKKAFIDCYDHRKDSSFYKFVMNACIGYFQRNNNPALSFISAIVILRCNIDMIRRCYQLEDEGNTILFIATDSIAWKGKLSPIAIDEKYLGSFTYEGKNIKFLGYSCKAYQWLNNGECTTKYSGMKKEESALLKFGELQYKGDAQERKKYQWDANDMQFIESALI